MSKTRRPARGVHRRRNSGLWVVWVCALNTCVRDQNWQPVLNTLCTFSTKKRFRPCNYRWNTDCRTLCRSKHWVPDWKVPKQGVRAGSVQSTCDEFATQTQNGFTSVVSPPVFHNDARPRDYVTDISNKVQTGFHFELCDVLCAIIERIMQTTGPPGNIPGQITGFWLSDDWQPKKKTTFRTDFGTHALKMVGICRDDTIQVAPSGWW